MAPMHKKLVVFLIAIIGFIALLVYIEQGRESPWSSDLFFGALTPALLG